VTTRSNTFFAFILSGIISAGISPSALAADVAIVISRDIAMYREAAAALEKALPPGTAATYVFSSESKSAVSEVLRQVHREKPKLVVAIGSKAAAEASRELPKTPMVYLMVVYPEQQGLLDIKNAYGVSWQPSASALVSTIRTLLPGAKRVGILSSLPKRASSDLAEECESAGLDLNIASIKDSSELAQGLRSLSGKMDVMWMGSDPAVANESAYNLLKTFSVQNKIPFLVPFHLPSGNRALAGISVTPTLAGAAAQQLVEQLLAGKKPRQALSFSKDIELTIDLINARSIDVTIPEEAKKTAAKIFD
jgi:ABC-type uncharacterized transport system substrate-binding protein